MQGKLVKFELKKGPNRIELHIREDGPNSINWSSRPKQYARGRADEKEILNYEVRF